MYRVSHLCDVIDRFMYTPSMYRVCKLVGILLVILHWNACVYSLLTRVAGFGSDDTRARFDGDASLVTLYVYSFYWSTLVIMSNSDSAEPRTELECLYVIVAMIGGVLIVATVIGNVSSAVEDLNAQQRRFQHQVDGVKQYMLVRNVPKTLHHRVLRWFEYVREHKSFADDGAILTPLPDSLRMEIQVHVHLKALRCVSIFKDCEKGLLRQLVLRLRQVVFSPGDLICHQNDVGREMYIVKSGQLQVLDANNVKVVATLKDGAVFGEVSLLSIAGNRRMASVRSCGFSSLFVLSKQDLREVIEDYPLSKEMLVRKASALLGLNAVNESQVLASPCL